jgi:hypothetical protein
LDQSNDRNLNSLLIDGSGVSIKKWQQEIIVGASNQFDLGFRTYMDPIYVPEASLGFLTLTAVAGMITKEKIAQLIWARSIVWKPNRYQINGLF